MSSSISPPDPRFTPFLERALESLRAEVPASYGAIRDALGSRRLRLEVDDETMEIRGADGEVVVAPAPVGAPSPPLVRTTRSTLLRLLAGDVDLVDAVVAGDPFLLGQDDDLAAFHAALVAFLRGSIRAMTTPTQYREYRDGNQGGAR